MNGVYCLTRSEIEHFENLTSKGKKILKTYTKSSQPSQPLIHHQQKTPKQSQIQIVNQKRKRSTELTDHSQCMLEKPIILRDGIDLNSVKLSQSVKPLKVKKIVIETSNTQTEDRDDVRTASQCDPSNRIDNVSVLTRNNPYGVSFLSERKPLDKNPSKLPDSTCSQTSSSPPAANIAFEGRLCTSSTTGNLAAADVINLQPKSSRSHSDLREALQRTDNFSKEVEPRSNSDHATSNVQMIASGKTPHEKSYQQAVDCLRSVAIQLESKDGGLDQDDQGGEEDRMIASNEKLVISNKLR